MAKPRPTIVVAGSLAQKPGRGGHAWVFLQYLLGFRRLGWDVLFLDRLGTEDRGVRYVRDVLQQFAIDFSLVDGHRTVGLTRPEALERVRSSAFLLNVMGFLRDEEILAAAPRRVFLDIDPGFGQMWRELGLADVFAGHDTYVTIAENIGEPGCEIPTCGLDWIRTRQPVVLDQWPAQDGDGGRFTTIASWRGAYAPVDYNGKRYGLRVHGFRNFAQVPRLTGRPFEVALDIHPDEEADLALLAKNGWSLVEPTRVAGDPWAYRDYIQRSKAEFTVAKTMYVETQSGWFSDRSICYLASGKPVLAQDTGLDRLYPKGEGLLTFSTLDDALAGVEEIERDYARHAHAARDLAVDYFNSAQVLSRLLAAIDG